MSAPPLATQTLRFLVEAARHGNISRAALALGVSQPRLSQGIAALEQRLQRPLFTRNGRGVVPTPEGARAIAQAETLLLDLDALDAEMVAAAAQDGDDIAIGVPPSVSLILVAPLVKRLRQAMPHATLRVLEGYSGTVQRALANGEVDFGLLYAGQALAGMPAERLLAEQLLLAGRYGDKLLDRFDIPLWEAARLPLVLPSRGHGLRQLIEREARRNGLAFNVVLEIDALTPAKDICASEGLFTILPSCAVAREVAARTLSARPIVDPDLRRVLMLSTTTARPLTSGARAAARLCIETARRLVHDGAWLGEV